MTDFYSRNDVNYNGDVYSIPFPYIKEKEVQVFLDDTLFEDWFFLNDSQIKLRTIPQEVTSNTIVSVRRVTDIDKKVVTYTNNTLLNKENLNLSQDQLLFAVQEIYDNNIQNNIDIRAEVDEKVERVTEAVEKLDMLDDAVETAVNASVIAEEKASVVVQKEEELSQTINQATSDIAQQAALEKAEIDGLSDDLKESIKDLKVLTTLEIGDIGIAPLGIDETKGKRRYLNGQLIIQDQYVQFTNKVKSAVALYPSLACTESEWQTTATMTVGGQVGKFVVDDEAGTIRLPKIIMPIQGLTDLSKLAEIVEAGLPNITGAFTDNGTFDGNRTNGYTTSGAFTASGSRSRAGSGGISGSANCTVTLNASKSNPTYGNSNTVQQEQIQYPYFIQVATGAETEDNIINEIELNNPFSLLDYKYSEYELNNISWLRSEGQWNAKAVYPAVYDLLLKIYNGTETKAGVSVKLTTETFTDYDFVLNTADETFRLQLKVKQKFYEGSALVGLSNKAYGSGSNSQYIRNKDTGNVARSFVGSGGVGIFADDYVLRTEGPSDNNYQSIFIDPNGTLQVNLSDVEVSDLYLYFYVGETVQNANLVNIGRIQEQYTTKSMVDGQWIGVDYSIVSNTTLSANKSATYDLSSCLPNDGYNYEVLFSLQASTGETSGHAVNLSLGTDIMPAFIITKGMTRANASIYCVGCATVPVGTDRRVTIRQWSAQTCAIVAFNAVGYRRIGTNL